MAVKLARTYQHAVAQFLGGQATGQAVGKQVVVGVFITESLEFRVLRPLAVGFGKHDQLVESLEFPTVLDEVGRQPVQKPRMCGFLSLRTKIVRVAGKGFSEMPLPDSVYD